MKIKLALTVLLVILFTLPSSFAQEYKQWKLPNGAKMRLGKGRVSDLQYSPDGTLLAVASSIGTWLYDAHTGAEVSLLTKDTRQVNSVAFSPDGNAIATGDFGGTVRLWDVTTRELIRTFEGQVGWVNTTGVALIILFTGIPTSRYIQRIEKRLDEFAQDLRGFEKQFDQFAGALRYDRHRFLEAISNKPLWLLTPASLTLTVMEVLWNTRYG